MKIKSVGFIGFILVLLPWMTMAQISLNVPGNTKNTRFYSDMNNIVRPALSIVGFDNNENNSKGFGLKQILEKLYNGTANLLMTQTFNKIVDISDNEIDDPFNPSPNDKRDPITIVNDNSNILQCLAFVALVRYVLHENSITAQIPGATQTAPPDTEAIANLHAAFLKPKDWLLANGNSENDQGKWTRSIDNYARALDLYLALENAFNYYGGADRAEYNDPNSTVLLSKTQKKMVMTLQI